MIVRAKQKKKKCSRQFKYNNNILKNSRNKVSNNFYEANRIVSQTTYYKQQTEKDENGNCEMMKIGKRKRKDIRTCTCIRNE